VPDIPVRSFAFNGCSGSATFTLPEDDYTIDATVYDKTGRHTVTDDNELGVTVFGAPLPVIDEPSVGDYVNQDVQVSGGVDSPFVTRYEIYVGGQLQAIIPAVGPDFAQLVDISSLAEGNNKAVTVSCL